MQGGAFEGKLLSEGPYGGIFLDCELCTEHCGQHSNCGECAADAQCGWESAANTCRCAPPFRTETLPKEPNTSPIRGHRTTH